MANKTSPQSQGETDQGAKSKAAQSGSVTGTTAGSAEAQSEPARTKSSDTAMQVPAPSARPDSKPDLAFSPGQLLGFIAAENANRQPAQATLGGPTGVNPPPSVDVVSDEMLATELESRIARAPNGILSIHGDILAMRSDTLEQILHEHILVMREGALEQVLQQFLRRKDKQGGGS